jgi:hypothetical protein
MRYTDMFFDALPDKVRLVKATSSELMNIEGDPWGWFKIIPK